MPYIMVRPGDIRRVSVTCRCGLKAVAEIPRQVAAQVNVHFCQKCNTAYEITFAAGKWTVKRSEELNQEGVAVSSQPLSEPPRIEPECSICKGTGKCGVTACRNCKGRGTQKGMVN